MELGQSMRVLFVWTVEVPNLEENREPLLFSEGPAVHPFRAGLLPDSRLIESRAP